MFFKDKKIIFVHIPKTGGSSLEYAICSELLNDKNSKSVYNTSYKNFTVNGFFRNKRHEDLHGHLHSFISEYNKYLNIDEFLKFTVLRNPFDQIISLYNQLRDNMKIPSLEHFIMSDDGKSMRKFDHFIDQHRFVYIDDKLCMDKIFLFDHYNMVQNFVEEKFKIKIDRNKKLWSTKYTGEKLTKEMKEKFSSVHFKSIELYKKFSHSKVSIL